MKPNQLWRASYCCLVTIASSYLSYTAVKRYFRLTNTIAYQLRFGDRVDNEMLAYFTLLGFHLVSLCLFCIFSFVDSRNLANDGECFGSCTCCSCSKSYAVADRCHGDRQLKRLCQQLHVHELESGAARAQSISEQLWQVFVRGWQHFLPVCSVFHACSAYCLLLSQLVIKRACISTVLSKLDRSSPTSFADASNALLQLTASQLDCLLQRPVYFALPPADSNSSSSSNPDANLTATATATASAQNAVCLESSSALPLEFCNYAVSLLVLVCRYPAVLLCANRCFALLLASTLALHSLTALLDFQAVSVLFRIDCCTYIRSLFLEAHTTLLLVSLGDALLLLACVFVFEFAWKRMRLSLRDFLAVGLSPTQSAGRQRIHESDTLSDSSASNWYLVWREFSTHFHAHLLFAVGVILKIPYFWDLVVYYRTVGDSLFMLVTFTNALNAFWWTAIWFLLTVTRNQWRFSLLPAAFQNHCTRSFTVATIVSTISAPAVDGAQLETESVSVSDNGFRYYVTANRGASQPNKCCQNTPTTTSVFLDSSSGQFTPSSKQSLKRKSILRSATHSDFPLTALASHESTPHFHDQLDCVTMKVNNPVMVTSATAATSHSSFEQSVDSRRADSSYSAARRATPLTEMINFPGNLVALNDKQNAVIRVQTSADSVSSDSGCVPQSGPASSNASKRLTPATAAAMAMLPMRIASPSLPSPTSLQSGLTNDLTNTSAGPLSSDMPFTSSSTDAHAAQSSHCTSETLAGQKRPPSMIVDCPLHGFVYWPAQNNAEQLVFSEV